MKPETHSEPVQKPNLPPGVSLGPGNGGLAKINIVTDHSAAEIYPHGAHVTGFQKQGEAALLFMSQSSQFAAGKPIRGGVPIVFPWFGPREGAPMHGFGRLTSWDLREAGVTPEGGVQLCLELPQSALQSQRLEARVQYRVTVGETLSLELLVANTASDAPLTFENCLHTYFEVGDIRAVSISGLQGVRYLDRLENSACKVEAADTISIAAEVDRTYLDTTGPVEIHDTSLRRIIRVEKSGSRSTVVWNPWVAKSQAMPDFGDQEYQRMVCVESGNVADARITLAPGESASLKVVLSSRSL